MLREFIQWWLQLEGFELILWSIAIVSSFLFVLQTVISFFIDMGGDIDDLGQDGHADATQFFTIRNMIAFFTMFGWAGLAARKTGIANAWVLLIAVASGVLMVALLYFIMSKATKLRESGTLQPKNAISRIGQTYLRIPAQRNGLGKVQIQVQGRLVELDAMTDDSEDIATGKPIKVVNTLNEHILLVTSNLN